MGQPPPLPTQKNGSNDRGSTAALLFVTCFVFLMDLFFFVKIVPTFADVFASFGAKLPWLTVFVVGICGLIQGVGNPIYFFLFLVLSSLIVGLVAWKEWLGSKEAVGILIFTALFSVVFWGVVVVAMFLPMFELGNVKG